MKKGYLISIFVISISKVKFNSINETQCIFKFLFIVSNEGKPPFCFYFNTPRALSIFKVLLPESIRTHRLNKDLLKTFV